MRRRAAGWQSPGGQRGSDTLKPRPRGHASLARAPVGVTRTDASGHAEEEAGPWGAGLASGLAYRGTAASWTTRGTDCCWIALWWPCRTRRTWAGRSGHHDFVCFHESVLEIVQTFLFRSSLFLTVGNYSRFHC